MNRFTRVAALALAASTLSADAARAQAPPEPLPMGVPYLYQVGNLNQPNWYVTYRPLAYGPAPLYGYPSYYPFGSTGPVFGRYSWDYNVYYAAGLGWYESSLPSYPYPLRYPTYSYVYSWTARGW